MSGFGLISTNTEIFILTCIGLASTIYEVTTKQNDNAGDFIWNLKMPKHLENGQFVIKSVIYGVELVRAFTVHIYIATYLLIYYPVLTEHRRFLLTPWLLLTVVRSFILNLAIFLLGIIICITWDESITFPCLSFTAAKAADLGWSTYFFLAVHSFYYDLGRPYASWQSRKKVLLSRLETTKVDTSDQSTYSRDDVSSISSDLSEMLENTRGRRSAIERLLADATLEWFLNEAFGFQDVDDDVYEEGLAKRAEEFLSLSPREILQMKNKICPHVDELVKQAKLKRSLAYLRQEAEGKPPEEPVIRISDPLARFPYLDVKFDKKLSADDSKADEEFNKLTEDLVKEAKQKVEDTKRDEDLKLRELEERVDKVKEMIKDREETNSYTGDTKRDNSAQTVTLTKSIVSLFDKLQNKNNNNNNESTNSIKESQK